MESSEAGEPQPRTSIESRAFAVPARRRRPHRWVGVLYCLSCERELSEVLADENNETYLPSLGLGRIKTMAVPCQCGAVRTFESVKVKPLIVDAIANKPYSKV